MLVCPSRRPEDPLATSGPPRSKQLDRKLGLASVYAISIGAMMGSGIFVLPGLAANLAGPWVALSYLLAGLIVITVVLSKSELATAMPVAGGTFVYIDRSMGPWMGTIAGLGTWFALSAKTAFALVGLGAYLVLFSSLPVLPISLTILAVLLGLNYVGVGKASGLQIAIVAFTVISLFALVGLSGPELDRSLYSPAFPEGARGIVAGAGFVFVSYNGVTKVCSIAEEVKNPDRNIPLGMLLSAISMMVLYSLLATVITGSVPYTEMAHDVTPVATAARATLGPIGGLFFAGVAAIGLVSMCNAGVLATTRFPFAMGRSALLPDGLCKVSERFGTPGRAILLTAVLLVVLITTLPIEELAHLASGFTIFIFAIENIAVLMLRETSPGWYKPTFKSPLYPWTQVAGTMGCLGILVSMGEVALLGVALGLLLGTVWYFAYGRSRVDRSSALKHLIGEQRVLQRTLEAEAREIDPNQRKPTVIVPVFGYEPAPGRLVRVAAAFAEHGLVEVTRLEEVPEQVPLTEAIGDDEEANRLANYTIEVGHDAHVEVEFNDIVTHNARETLHHHAQAVGAKWVVMEPPTSWDHHSLLRHPMAWWLDEPPTHIGLFLDRGGEADYDSADDFPRILVLARPDPNDALVMHAADRLARLQRGGTLTLFDTLPSSHSVEMEQEHEAYLEQLGGMCSAKWRPLLIPANDPLDVIAKITQNYDLLVMGSPGGMGLKTLFRRSYEHKVAEQARCSVLRIRTSEHCATHDLFPLDDQTMDYLAVEPFLQEAAVVPHLPVASKQELFASVAHYLGRAADIEPSTLEKVLWKVEKRKNTFLDDGVALISPTVHGVETPRLGLFTTDQPVDYMGRTHEQVDVVVVVLGAHGHRQKQLWLLEHMNHMVLDFDLAPRLREARNAEAMRNACRAAAEDEITAEEQLE
ncbi:MAG: amino acid permease [Deltaproteobacteria bacterium]|nr:amino acid permease [Deltaproteobacteria bacterium]